MGHVDAAALGRHVVFLDVVERAADARAPEPVEEEERGRAHAPDEVVEVHALDDAEAEEAGSGDAEDAVGAASDAENVVGQRDAHDLDDADGDDEQVVAAQVDDGPRHQQGHEGGRKAG